MSDDEVREPIGLPLQMAALAPVDLDGKGTIRAAKVLAKSSLLNLRHDRQRQMANLLLYPLPGECNRLLLLREPGSKWYLSSGF